MYVKHNQLTYNQELKEFKLMHNFQEFLDYIESFYAPYHPDVLYPIDGLNTGEIAIAILRYLDLCASTCLLYTSDAADE